MRIDPKEIIKCLKKNRLKVRATARELGISPGTVINWRTKARSVQSRLSLRVSNLERKSTRPKSVRATSLSAKEQDLVVKTRKQENLCALKITAMLKLEKSHMVVHRFLKSKSLVKERKKHWRPWGQETHHMHVKNVTAPGKLQMDVKYVTPQLSGLPYTCFLYAIIDIYSRFKLGVIYPDMGQDWSIGALQILLPVLPCKPDFIQTDNGLEFQQRFKNYVTKDLGMQHHYIHKSTPNENAVIERSFRTDEDEFFFFRLKTRPKDIFELNKLYSEYLVWYNDERIHLSLGMKTPLEVIQSGVI